MNSKTRFALIGALVLAALIAVLAVTGCQKKVEVRTGTVVECTYEHTISDDVETLKVPAKEASKYRVKTVTKTCDKHKQLESLYDEAQEALAKGETAVAEKMLAEVVAGDKLFRNASQQLDEIKSGKTPSAGSGSSSPATGGGTLPKPGEGATGTPAAGLLRWAPDSIAGYKAEKPAVDVMAIAREYVPESGSSNAIQMVVVAEQYRDGKGAASQLARQVTSRYTKDVDRIKVNGHDAYFGTDGRRFAIIGFVDGSVMVAIEISAREQGSPVKLKSSLVAAAKQLP